VKKISILLPVLLAVTILQGCSGGSSSSSSGTGPLTIRLLNATTTTASQSLNIASTGAAIATIASAVSAGTVSSYATITSGTSVFTLSTSAASSVPLAQSTYTLSPNIPYTMVAYSNGTQLQAIPMLENELAPATGFGKIRLLNLSADAGKVDFYMAPAGSDMAAASPWANNISMGTTGYYQFASAVGPYHIVVTGAGSGAINKDVRLDIPSVVVSDQQIQTLVLSSTAGGALVDGLLVTQQGAVIKQKNGSVRIRVAANIIAGSSVSAVTTQDSSNNKIGLGANLSSQVIGSYNLVTLAQTGSAVPATTPLTISGISPILNYSAIPGADYTLLSVGNGTTQQSYLLPDLNTQPNAGMAKVRLVNGVSGIGNGTISLKADYTLLTLSPVAFGSASDPTNVNAGTITKLEVDWSGAPCVLINQTLAPMGVYSVFMLGDITTAGQVCFLKRDY
jgi:Domain of unknown function (DUF4397)